MRSRPAPGRRPPASVIFFAGLATAAALFASVTVQSLVGQTQIRTSDIARRIEQKKEKLEALEVDVARLSSLDRVAARARQLGLVPPPAIAFLPAPDAGKIPTGLTNATVPSYEAPSPQAKPSSSSKPKPRTSSSQPSHAATASTAPSPPGGGH